VQNTTTHLFTWYRASPPLPSNNRQFFSGCYLHTMSSSAPQTTTIPAILSIPISDKLTKTNYPLWRAQVLPTVRATDLEGLITSTEKAPNQYVFVTNDGTEKALISMSPSPTMTRPSPRRLIPRIMCGSPKTKPFLSMFYLPSH
jgi:hypothetical protein